MTRAIVRFSMDNDGGKTNNEVRRVLVDAGFVKFGTSSYDYDGLSQADALAGIRDMLDLLEDPPGRGAVDHLWVYMDETTQVAP